MEKILIPQNKIDIDINVGLWLRLMYQHAMIENQPALHKRTVAGRAIDLSVTHKGSIQSDHCFHKTLALLLLE